MASDTYNIVDINPKSSSGSSSGDTDFSDTSTPNIDDGIKSPCHSHSSIDLDDKIDHCEHFDVTAKTGDQCGSPSTSRRDPVRQSSLESSDLNIWIRSESENSVPSWASSISLDSQTEEAIVEFMRKFIAMLFEDSSSISLDIKSEFGLKTRVTHLTLLLQTMKNLRKFFSKKKCF